MEQNEELAELRADTSLTKQDNVLLRVRNSISVEILRKINYNTKN